MRKEKLEELNVIVEELRTIEVQRKELEQNKKFLQSERYIYTINNGMIIEREKLIKGGKDGSAAITVPVLKNDEVLTIIEPRVFTSMTVGVGFPAGYIENGEDITVGALRELREETGYVPNEIIKLDSFYQDEGCSSALNHIFMALNCTKMFSQKLDEDEIVKYMVFNYDELLELERLGYIMGCNSKLALVKAQKYLGGR